MKPLVFDATPLIYLGKIELLDKVAYFPEDKYITKSIFREVVEKGKEIGEPEAFRIEKIVEAGIIKIKNPHDKKYIGYLADNPKIHQGDVDTLALASELGGIALLDDEEARNGTDGRNRASWNDLFAPSHDENEAYNQKRDAGKPE